MSPERDVVVHLPDSVGEAERKRLKDSLQLTAVETWAELGLPSAPSVSIDSTGEQLGEVRVDGRPLPISARRRRRVADAFAPAGPSESRDAEAFVRARFDDATEKERAALVQALVRAAAHAAVADLVEMDADALPAPRVLRLAGALGLAPSQVAPEGLSSVGADPQQDPHLACETLLATSQSAGLINPVLELSRSTLRRLTASQRALRPELFDGSGRLTPGAPRGIRTHAYSSFGVNLPNIGLAMVDDIRIDRFRVRFGPVRGFDQVVPPDRWTAVESVRDFEIAEPVIGEYMDPVNGDWWPVVESTVSASGIWHARYYDPPALVIRALYAELQQRLSWWAPGWLEGDWGWSVSGSLAERLYERLPAVLRWLVAGGATMQPSAPIMEGVVTSMAEGDASVPGMVRRAREKLRGAVLGPLPLETAQTLVHLDPSVTGEALARSSPAPLLATHPELRATTGAVVAVTSADVRADIERLMSPLTDVVRVASDQELAGAVLQTPELAVNSS
jgi:hypothetical protein